MTLFLVSSGGPAWASAVVEPPRSAQLGLVMRASRAPDGGKVLEFLSRDTGRRLVVRVSALGDYDEMTEYSASGRMLDRRSMHSGMLVHERFDRIHTVHIVRAAAAGTDQQEVEWIYYLEGRAVRVAGRVRESDALRCRPPEPPANWQQLLNNLDWVKVHAETTTGDRVDLGSNLQAVNCRNYPRDGLDGLARDLQAGIREGLACLARYGGDRQMDAARMTAFLQPGYGTKATITCGHVGATVPLGNGRSTVITGDEGARAHDCTEATFPSMHINLDSNSVTRENKAVFFHEMLHWLGYRHSEGFDVTYLMQKACFPTGSDAAEAESKRVLADQMLRDNDAWTDPRYQRNFMTLMILDGRRSVAVRTAWASAMAAPRRGTPPRPDAGGLYAASIRMGTRDPEPDPAYWRDNAHPFLGMILARAAAENVQSGVTIEQVMTDLNSKLRDRYYPASDPALLPKRQLANWIGQVASDAINGNVQHINTVKDQVLASAAAACPTLSQNEKEQLDEALDTTALQVMGAPGVDSGFALKWRNICH